MFKRIIRLTRIPHRTKLSTALKQFTSDSLKALAELNAELVIEQIKQLGLDTVTIDLDGTGSSDIDPRDSITFAWDLDNDGEFDDSTEATPQFSLDPCPEDYDICLKVTD